MTRAPVFKRRYPALTVLAWTAATDNIGVSAYDIYRDGHYLATVGPEVTSNTDATASPHADHTYQVAARDLAGNATRATVEVAATTDRRGRSVLRRRRG